MKREDVKNKIPGITDDQLDWLMSENGADINREKTAAAAVQAELDKTKGLLQTAQEGLAKFDGVDVADLKGQVEKLTGELKAQADSFAFDKTVDTAILTAKGRSIPAVRALLDLTGLKDSKDLTADISKALEDAQKANPWAFGEAVAAAATVSTGAEHGDPMSGAKPDPVEAAFSALNPNIKL